MELLFGVSCSKLTETFAIELKEELSEMVYEGSRALRRFGLTAMLLCLISEYIERDFRYMHYRMC